MPGNFNDYPGMPQNGSTRNGYGELTNSLIFPGPLPFQQPFQQIWSPTGWQNNGQENFNMGSSFQGNMTGSNAYFPAQPDFVAFDDGDDFYNNDDPDTPMTSEHMEDTTESNGTFNRDHSSNPPGPTPTTTSLPHAYKPEVTAGNRGPSHSNGSESTQEAPSVKSSEAQLAALRAAALRAKLMSQRRVGGKTPTPESVPEQKPGTKEKSSLAGFVSANNDGTSSSKGTSPTTQTHTPTVSVPVAIQSGEAPAAKSSGDTSVLSVPKVSSTQQSHTSTDIEALLAEARDTVGTKKDDSPIPKTSEGTSKASPNTVMSATHHSTLSTTKPSEPLSASSRLQSLQSSKASSEVSEQGEIREEPKRTINHISVQAAEPTTLENVQAIQKSERTSDTQDSAHGQAQLSQKKQQPGKIDTSLANDRNVASATSSAKPKSPLSLRTPVSSKSRDFRDDPPASNPNSRDKSTRYADVRDRMTEASWVAPDRRQEHNSGPPREALIRDTLPQRPYVRGPRRYDEYRPTYPARPDIIEENERKAAEYKRNLHQVKVEPKDAVMAEAEAINEPPKPSPKIASPKPSVVAESAEYYADVNEWLEMTGYHDQTYRKKALARHQKLLALDKERAELEREAQTEREEQSQMIRAQSIMPRDSVERPTSRPAITPRTIPNFTMPPPPVPAKDSMDDVGIQIKDLATREATSPKDHGISSTQQLHESSRPFPAATKRQHSGDDLDSPRGRLMDKIVRTNSKDFSSDTKVQQPIAGAARPMTGSLESRISVDEGNFRREYQQRSRSPEMKQRSLSPPSRRASGQDNRMERQFSRGSYGSRNGYSPNRRPAYSRNASPSHLEAGLYDDSSDGNIRRYDSYRYDNDPRANVEYDRYGANPRGGPYPQYQAPNSRGRGRGRGRGSFNPYRGNGYKVYDDLASG
ncbi:hypothetical protein MMC26_003785 [Xylographa opegraphella]|nr:hypothetical protein [Xylographa opegraphella]